MKSRIALFAISAVLCAQVPQARNEQPSGSTPYPVPPDVADARYGPHERNVMDVWKGKSPASPLVVFFHGGGFTAGDKSRLPPPLFQEARDAGYAVATINYRYSTQAPYPAPMADGARAIQFLRLHANEWNINPRAIAASGNSAGAGISLWLGFHDDMAEPASDDPVKRQSTRLSVVGVINAQSSYDPRFVAKLVGEEIGRHPALATLFGVPSDSEVFTATRFFRLYEDGSPITHLSAGDLPAFMVYSFRMSPLPVASLGEGIHNSRFGYALKEKMDKLGIECIVRTPADYLSEAQLQMSREVYRDMVTFFKKAL
jgi:hypothetical protein